MADAVADPRTGEIDGLKKTLMQHREMETKLKNLRESVSDLGKEYQKTEDDLQALQVGAKRWLFVHTHASRGETPRNCAAAAAAVYAQLALNYTAAACLTA